MQQKQLPKGGKNHSDKAPCPPKQQEEGGLLWDQYLALLVVGRVSRILGHIELKESSKSVTNKYLVSSRKSSNISVRQGWGCDISGHL